MKKYDNYCSNLRVLAKSNLEDLNNEFIIGGIVDKFNIQFELGWKLLKELLKYEGVAEANTGSPREIIKAAYKVYDFLDEEIWLSMLKSRNDMSHLYDGNAARKLVDKIIGCYIAEFEKMRREIEKQYKDILETL